MPRIVAVIPARLESTRLPRKPLRLIARHPMIAWVYHHARRAASLDQVLIATDAAEIMDYCRGAGIPAEMTSDAHRSGTDRIVEVMSRVPADIYVNIQGDEPMVTDEHIELMLKPFRESRETQVSTLKVAISNDEALNPNNVKVVTDLAGRALYFSRARIPHDRDGSGRVQYYKHMGLYAYSAAVLSRFQTLAPTALEQLEKLEQLRLLENGIPIHVLETRQDTIGVDTEVDLKKVEEIFRTAGFRLPPL
jgi:3-deoxy-manno-octulosonate cytidylyltransferase (CMP-KDO synthetase)